MSKAERGERGRRAKFPTEALSITHPNAGGVDIGAREIWVSVPEERTEKPVRAFCTFTPDLEKLAHWLLECGVDTVAMEATGVYWVPLYEILQEHGIEVCLVNARHVKNVPGRKSDVMDCQWLRRLHAFGLLRASFRPDAEITVLRTYLRRRNTLVSQAADEVRRIHKSMTLMNLQIHHVLSDITGKTGLAILRGIVAGERRPSKLVEHRDPRCRADQAKMEAALTGNYQPDHLFTLRQALELWDVLQAQLRECDTAAADLLDRINPGIERPELPPKRRKKRRAKVPHVDYREPLYALSGVDITDLPGFADNSAASLIAETGIDMSKWPTVEHFASWLRLVPRNDITGGRVKNRRTLPSSSRASQILRWAALSAGKTQTAIGAFYRNLAARKGKAVAVVATAHKLARIIYAMLKNGRPFEPQKLEDWELARRTRTLKSMRRRAKQFGFQLVACPDVAEA